MPIVRANGIDVYYDTFGDPTRPTILLVMGLATQSIAWPDPFVDRLVAGGFRVVRYDNRDVGLSTHLTGAPAINPVWAIAAKRFGLPFPLAYRLSDMAADGIGLLDTLGIDEVHVVGASMGGMIAQLMAAHWPDRVLSLTSIMSSSGAPGLPGPSPQIRRKMLARRPANPSRADAIAASVEMLRLISYPDPTRDAKAFEDIATRAFDRAHDPVGARRQLLAIIADGSRATRLAAVRAPTLLIHGADDPLVPLAGSEDLARHIPHARLEIVPGMAHDLPPSRLDRIAAMIVEHARGATVDIREEVAA
jgi:pimeloyl-ACP methyl ester carboxylesterase